MEAVYLAHRLAYNDALGLEGLQLLTNYSLEAVPLLVLTASVI